MLFHISKLSKLIKMINISNSNVVWQIRMYYVDKVSCEIVIILAVINMLLQSVYNSLKNRSFIWLRYAAYYIVYSLMLILFLQVFIIMYKIYKVLKFLDVKSCSAVFAFYYIFMLTNVAPYLYFVMAVDFSFDI